MWQITWKDYWELTAVLATVYYLAVYALFFRKANRDRTGSKTDRLPEDDAVQKENEGVMP